jgi:predicted MPP superfamily phosphohydrolase
MEATTHAGAGVIVCGHTHGGQMWPFNYLTRAVFPFHHGLYRAGSGYVFTTCGIGFWGPPMRVGAPPEIVQIRLIPENEPPSVIWNN